MKKWFVLGACVFVAGCAAQSEEALNVTLQPSVEEVAVWEPITFDVTVETFGEMEQQAIVEIEILNEAEQTIGILPASHVQDGRYTLETVLDVAGDYEVISHVTVDEHHSMPSTTITVVE